MLVPIMCWLAKHNTQARKSSDNRTPEKIFREPLEALRATHAQRAEIEKEYLRRLRQEAQQK